MSTELLDALYSSMNGEVTRPIGRVFGGFVVGAGHGSTFEDAYGNFWNSGTMWVGVNWKFERRVDLFPAGFDKQKPYLRVTKQPNL